MKRILIPTDFSVIADNAIEYALALPKEGVQEALLLHADANIDEKFIKLNKQANRLSEKFKTEIINSEESFSADMIKEVIKNRFIDFMIMGTSGEDGSIAKKIFGNNTSSIIDDLNCPVIVVPVGYVSKGITKIGYASDFTDIDNELRQVITFAKTFNAVIEVLHIVPVYPDLYDTENIDIEQTIDRIRKKYDYSNIHYVIEETENDNEIKKGIKQFAEHYKPDLLVMFHLKRAYIDKLINPSETANLITHLELPLLIFPK